MPTTLEDLEKRRAWLLTARAELDKKIENLNGVIELYRDDLARRAARRKLTAPAGADSAQPAAAASAASGAQAAGQPVGQPAAPSKFYPTAVWPARIERAMAQGVSIEDAGAMWQYMMEHEGCKERERHAFWVGRSNYKNGKYRQPQ